MGVSIAFGGNIAHRHPRGFQHRPWPIVALRDSTDDRHPTWSPVATWPLDINMVSGASTDYGNAAAGDHAEVCGTTEGHVEVHDPCYHLLKSCW